MPYWPFIAIQAARGPPVNPASGPWLKRTISAGQCPSDYLSLHSWLPAVFSPSRPNLPLLMPHTTRPGLVLVRKNDRMAHLKFVKLQWGSQKPKFENFKKKGWCMLQITRGFQIWPQNLNRTIFDPLLEKNGRKLDFAGFRPFLPKTVFCFLQYVYTYHRCFMYSLLTDFTRKKRHSNVSYKWHFKKSRKILSDLMMRKEQNSCPRLELF